MRQEKPRSESEPVVVNPVSETNQQRGVATPEQIKAALDEAKFSKDNSQNASNAKTSKALSAYTSLQNHSQSQLIAKLTSVDYYA